MKLKEFLESSIELDGTRVLVEMVMPKKTELTGKKEIQPYFEQIKSCDEFKECNLQLMEMPAESQLNRTLVSITKKLGENTFFTGDCFLYQVSLTPVLYDPNTFEPTRGSLVRGVFDTNRF